MNKKFINSINITDFEILTDTGWEDIIALHTTIPYEVYEIKTNNGCVLKCADNHIVFNKDLIELFVKDLNIDDTIITDKGVSTINSIVKLNFSENMFDFELGKNSNHRYYTNGILSHNTEIARTVAKLLDVPFCICDCTSLTQAGYVGDDIETILTNLLQAADYDVERAEQGIVFLDEIDKLGRKGGNASISRDVGGEGVQQGLLKIIEGAMVSVPPQGGRKHPDAKLIKVNTNNILFIAGGAFEGIEQRIAQRMNVHTIGYTDETKKSVGKKFDKKNPLHSIIPEDVVKFGLIPELVGRLPVITTLGELDKAALRKILTEPKNALVKQYQKLFAMDGITLTFEEKAYDYIVDKAVEYKLGARGLRGIMEEIMTKIMYDAPSGDKKIIKVTLKQAQKIYG